VEKAQKVGLLRPIWPKITLAKKKGKIERARRKKGEEENAMVALLLLYCFFGYFVLNETNC